jgi:hypothetical protein
MFNRLNPCEHIINQEEVAQKNHLAEKTARTGSKERGFFCFELNLQKRGFFCFELTLQKKRLQDLDELEEEPSTNCYRR